MQNLFVFLLLAATATAPALDFLDPARIPREYGDCVQELRDAIVCDRDSARPNRPTSYNELTTGDTLVRPVLERRVPIAVGYEAHFHAAKLLPFPKKPLHEYLSEENQCAAKFAATTEPTLLTAFRRRRIALIQKHAAALRPHSARLNAEDMTPDVYRIARGTNTFFLACLLDAKMDRDRDMARLHLHGFPALGVMQDSFSHRFLGGHTPTTLASFDAQYRRIMATNEAWADEVEWRTKHRYMAANPAQLVALEAMEATNRKELSRGLISPALSRHQLIKKFGYGRYRVMLPFTILQKSKWRLIDNAKSSLHNNATFPIETIVTPSFEFPLHIARAMRLYSSGSRLPMPAIAYGLDDLEAAYRTIPTSEQRFQIRAMWSPTRQRVEYHYTYGFMFGLVSSVTQFNRFPDKMASAARMLGGVPTAHYFDDYQVVDVLAAGSSGQDLLYELHRAAGDGIPFNETRTRVTAPAIEPKKRLPMAPVNVGLGVQVDLSEAASHRKIHFRPTQQRIDFALEVWANASRDNHMSPETAASLRGKMGFLLEAAYGRVGRAASLVLVQREYRDHSPFLFTTEMGHAYAFYRALLRSLPTRSHSIDEDPRPPLLVYTDAMFRPRKRKRRDDDECSTSIGSTFVSRLGIVLYDPMTGELFYGADKAPDSIIQTFETTDDGEPLKTYIAQMEVLAAVAIYYTFPDRFRGRNVNHFIDNTVALSALVHGYARKRDLARMVNSFHLQAAALQMKTYLEFVPSLANLADLPSRDEFEVLERLGGRRVPIAYPPAEDWVGPLDVWTTRLRSPAD